MELKILYRECEKEEKWMYESEELLKEEEVD
jgi:hypothetical protein